MKEGKGGTSKIGITNDVERRKFIEALNDEEALDWVKDGQGGTNSAVSVIYLLLRQRAKILELEDEVKQLKICGISKNEIVAIRQTIEANSNTVAKDMSWLRWFLAISFGVIFTSIVTLFQMEKSKEPPVSAPSQTLQDSQGSGGSGGYTGSKTHSRNPVSILPKRGDKSQVHPVSK